MTIGTLWWQNLDFRSFCIEFYWFFIDFSLICHWILTEIHSFPFKIHPKTGKSIRSQMKSVENHVRAVWGYNFEDKRLLWFVEYEYSGFLVILINFINVHWFFIDFIIFSIIFIDFRKWNRLPCTCGAPKARRTLVP